ncbi:MAG: acyl-CoA dehydrogenase family protein [Rhodospirillales bacterium]
MELGLTEEQTMLRDVAQEFCRRELAPLVDNAEANQEFPRAVYPQMAKLGFLGIGIPREYGGQGLGKLEESLFIEELACVCGGFASSWMVQSCIVPAVLAQFASPSQKERYLQPMLRGEKIGSLGVTEPNAGSDVKGVTTTATRVPEGWRIKGTKSFITQGTACDFAIVLAYTNKAGGINGMDLFLVDRSVPGFSSTKMPKHAYQSSETAWLHLDDCVVPADAIIGDENSQAFRRIMKTFIGERILVAARSIGIARGALEQSEVYVKERQQFGRAIGSFQAVAFRVAEMATSVEAARLFAHHVARLWDQNIECTREVAMAKLFATEAAVEVTEKAMRIFGGHGLVQGAFPVQRMFMDARVSIVTVGSSDIQKRAIARYMGLACD